MSNDSITAGKFNHPCAYELWRDHNGETARDWHDIHSTLSGGRAGEARKAIARAMAIDPQATVKQQSGTRLASYKDPKDLEHFLNGLRMAGLPEE